MTEGGARLLDRVASGADVEARPGEARLLNALIDAGVVNLRPEQGPWSAAEVTLVVPVRDRPDGLAALLASVGAAALTIPGRRRRSRARPCGLA